MATNTRATLLFALALLATPAGAQERPDPTRDEPLAPNRAVPLHELGPGRVQFLRARLDRAGGGCFDEARWRERLLEPDLELRELAFEELVRELPRCIQGQRAVQAWALNAEPALAWSARLALRELRRVPGAAWTQVTDLAPELLRGEPGTLTEADFGLQLRSFPGLPDGLFAYGGGLGLHSPRAFSLPNAQCEQRDGRVYCLRMGAEGVAVEILEAVQGGESRKSYTGLSLEQILEAHPELAREVPELQSMVARRGDEGDLSLRWSQNRVRLLLGPTGSERGSDVPGGMPRTLVIRGEHVLGADVLGVDCEPIAPERARQLELEPACGLVVERTWPGSIATDIELKRGDVLLELNGHTLRTGADLRAAIHVAIPSGRLVVRLIDGEGQTRSLTWEPGDE